MRKLTIMLNSGNNVASIKEPFIAYSNILVKKAYIFWKYYNIPKDDFFNVSVINTKQVIMFTLHKGYYTFDDLKRVIEKSYGGISLTLDPVNLIVTFKITADITLDFSRDTAHMLGFNVTQFTRGTTVSNDIVNMNLDLESIKIHCNIIDTSININESDEKSDVLINLPVTTKQPLLGSVQSFTDIETKLDVNKGVVSRLEFKVTNNGKLLKNFGNILLDIYIE